LAGLARAADDASLTRSGIIAGTPQYMSPEQARGDTPDHRSDLFSLGSVLYAMCTGRPPFRAETPLAMLRRICDEAPRPIREVNPETPPWLARIIERLHAKRPEDRYQSAGELARVLEQCLAHVQQPTVAPLPKDLVEQTQGAARFWIIGAGVLAAVVLVGLFVGAANWFPAPGNGNRPEVTTPSESAALSDDAGRAKPQANVEPEPVMGWDDGVGIELQSIDRAVGNLELMSLNP
jgi:serine/threonine-protein kinase